MNPIINHCTNKSNISSLHIFHSWMMVKIKYCLSSKDKLNINDHLLFDRKIFAFVLFYYQFFICYCVALIKKYSHDDFNIN